ncbi:MAG: LPS export ABC transporter periplasmic protein LptC [Legionellales bacterium]|nr:LPS export ABC transporter periplasmic protein LptC [Legionellales bacterium]|tara:strand:+ start:25 stop:630 length:606 start_codon:yes stop_codon:yes gene_type:complete
MLRQFFGLRKVFGIAALILLVAYTSWLVKETGISKRTTIDVNKNHPNFFAKNVHSKEFDSNGKLIHILNSPYLLHYPKKDSAVLTKPQFIIYSTKNDKAPWFVTANQGKTINGTDIIHLTGNVIIHEPQSKSNNNLTIKTEALTIYPKRNFAETNKSVSINEPGITVHSIGMKVYFKQKRVILLNQARGVYDEQKTTQPHE